MTKLSSRNDSSQINRYQSTLLFCRLVQMNQMTPLENIYSAIGEAAYAIALSDGAIQREEKEKLEIILKGEFDGRIANTNHATIIFHILQKERSTIKDAYNAAMHTFNANSHYLSMDMKKHFVTILERVASSFPPATAEEKALIEKFKSDILAIKIDETLSKDM